MFAIMRKRVLLESTEVPSTKMNRIILKITLVTLNTLFQSSISEEVRLSFDVSLKTSHVYGARRLQRKTTTG